MNSKKIRIFLKKILFNKNVPLLLLIKFETFIRKTIARYRLRESPYIILPNGKRMMLHPYDEGLSYDLVLNVSRIRELPATLELLKFFNGKKFKLMFDIGSNLGYFTLLLSDYFEKIVAMEPVSLCVNILKENIRINKIAGKVHILQAALAEKRGKLKISLEESLNVSKVVSNKGFVVDSLTYDDLVDTFGVPDFMKLDIEGYEYEIFQRDYRNELPKYLYIEIHPIYLGYRKTMIFLDRLKEFGYSIIFASKKRESMYDKAFFTRPLVILYQKIIEGVYPGIILKNADIQELKEFIKKDRENKARPYSLNVFFGRKL